MRVLGSTGRRIASSLAVIVTLAGCASLAVNPCDTIPDRDGKYFARFFLGVATLGLSEVTIQQEEFRQVYEGSPGVPPARWRARRDGVSPGSRGRAVRRARHAGQRGAVAHRRLSEPGPGCARCAAIDRSVPGEGSPDCLSTRTVPPGGAPDRRRARRPAPRHLEPAGRGRSASPGVQAHIQPGGLQVTGICGRVESVRPPAMGAGIRYARLLR